METGSQWQAMFYNNRFSATPDGQPRLRWNIAVAYGFRAENVSMPQAELDAAIAPMAGHEGTYLLNVNIDLTDMVFPMVAPPARPLTTS